MKIRIAAAALAVFAATGSVSAQTEIETDIVEEEAKPAVALHLIVEDAMQSSKVTGVSVPLMLLSIGTIVAAPVSP